MRVNISAFLHKRGVIPALVGVTTFSGGVALGYIWGKRNGEVVQVTQYFQKPKVIVTETEEPLIDENQLTIFEPDTGPQLTVDEIISDEGYSEPAVELTVDVVPEEPKRRTNYAKKFLEDDDIAQGKAIGVQALKTPVNIFHPGSLERWNYETEIAKRNPKTPYVIHRDEFFGEEMGYSQHTYTYYDEDNILADESETPIHNYPKVIGELKFGYGTDDPNVFYCRNEQNRCEYEVLYTQGSFEMEVLGYSIEQDYATEDLKHSAYRKLRPE